MRRHILAGYACITHNGDAGPHFFILTRAFKRHRKGVIGAQLVSHFVHHVIDIKIVTLWNAVSR